MTNSTSEQPSLTELRSNCEAIALYTLMQSIPAGKRISPDFLRYASGFNNKRYMLGMTALKAHGLVWIYSQKGDDGHFLGKEIKFKRSSRLEAML